MKKKICIIASSPMGIVNFHKSNIEKLANEYDVYIVANFTDEKTFYGVKIKGAKHIAIERKPSIFKDLAAIINLYFFFRAEKIDAYLSMSSKASLVSSIAGFFARVPVRIRIFTGQLWAHKTGCGRRFYKNIDRLTVALNTNTLVDGRSQQEYLIENKIFKNGESQVLANGSICGVDLERFKYNSIVKESEKHKFNLSESQVVFAFMGRINKDKGIFELLAAYNKLAKDYQDVMLVLIGNSEGITNDVLNNYEYLEKDKNIILYGFTKTPENSLQIADVFCLPSYREGFGMSAIEAAALGLPVICSDAYGLRDSFVNGQTGLKCKVKDVDSLYECMLEFYSNKNLRIESGNLGRERVERLFSMDLVSSAWLNYFKELV